MQSGISGNYPPSHSTRPYLLAKLTANPPNPASTDLLTAFQSFTSDPSQRALLASISNEKLIPTTTIPSHSPSFHTDLALLQPHLGPTTALYILLRLSPAADGYAAITYVPDAAPVRQKMLFASTRLTLVRELGLERFSETLVVTTREEVSEEGWRRHERHGALAAPLTEEERSLRGVVEAEARESGGTGGRRGVVRAGKEVRVGEGVWEALERVEVEMLVQLKIDTQSEAICLVSSTPSVSPSALSTTIFSSDPRYSFYRYPTGDSTSATIFIYTCPSTSKIKERMIYASSKQMFLNLVKEKGIEVTKRLEATGPDEISEDVLRAEFAPKEEVRQTFSKPKRPGRR
ncbi:Twinfilin-1 [Elasticomyces elasticus]|nr:hypothetical protein LTR28_013982 [Elasticomyces elasticus]KAK4998206.1 Twinfilin-1 [Elasticomyces elasticus]